VPFVIPPFLNGHRSPFAEKEDWEMPGGYYAKEVILRVN
jgi:hypothetical protein